MFAIPATAGIQSFDSWIIPVFIGHACDNGFPFYKSNAIIPGINTYLLDKLEKFY